MFKLIFLKEFKYIIKSLTFWIMTLAILLIYFTQFLPELNISNLDIKKQVSLENKNFVEKQSMMLKLYGSKPIDSKKKEMAAVYSWLRRDYLTKTTTKTKLLLNSTVDLNDKQLKSIKEALEKMIPDGFNKVKNIDDYNKINVEINYNDYLKLIKKLDYELGGNTKYKFKDRYLVEARTYEEYKKDMESVINNEKISNSYARLFCDYIGIGLGIFPIFITSFLLIRGNQKNIYQVVYSRKVSSITYVISKFIAIILAITLMLIILIIHATISTSILARSLNLTIDYFAYLKYVIIWLLPTTIYVTAISMFISVLFNNGLLPILIIIIQWFISIIDLKGNYFLYKYIIRFNSFGYVEQYNSYFKDIVLNRIFYILISSCIIIFTILIFEQKRKKVGEKN